MLNILFVSPTGALINGAERSGITLMAHLAEVGFRIVNAFPQHYRIHDPEAFTSYYESMQSGGIEQLPLDYGWWIPGDEQFAQREFTAVAEIISTIHEHDIDVVISNTSNVPWGALAAVLTGREHMWLLHEFPTGTFSWLDDKYDFIAEFSSAIFCASPSLRDVVQSRVARTRWRTPVRAFRPYSDVSSTTLADAQQPRIVVVGSVNRRKNQIEAVRMLPALRGAGLSPSMLFIGEIEDEEYRAEIDQLATDLGVARQLTFVGHREMPWCAVSPMDIVLQCSEIETFSLVACEAAKLGLRLILARNPSAIDLASLLEGIVVYDAGDIGGLTSVVERMLRDPDSTLREAASTQETALAVLSRDSGHAPILAELLSLHRQPPSSAVVLFGPYFSNFVAGTRQEIARLTRQDTEAQSLIRALGANLESLTAELSAVYNSRTWRIARVASAPLRALLRLRRRHARRGP